MILKYIKYSVFSVAIVALLSNFSLNPLSLKLKSLDSTKKPTAQKSESAKPAATETAAPVQDSKFSAPPAAQASTESGNLGIQATPPPDTLTTPQNTGPKIGSLSSKKPMLSQSGTGSLQANKVTDAPNTEPPATTPQPTDQEKPKTEDDFSLEKVEQTNRNWQESPNERTSYMKEAADYYKKISDLVKNSNKIMDEKEKASEDINGQLNQTYSQASSTMGNFVEIGRNIENYVHGQIEKYAEQKK